MGEDQYVTTDEDVAAARVDFRRGIQGAVAGVTAVAGIAAAGAGAVVPAVLHQLHSVTAVLIFGLVGTGIAVPLISIVVALIKRRALRHGAEGHRQERRLRTEAHRRDFETRLGRALEVVDDETDAYDVIARAMAVVVPEAPVELLLADNSHAHLDRVVVSSPDGEREPGCPVDSPDHCVAARRAQVQVFPDSEDLDACRLLRGRTIGRCAGVCVPVSIMGRTVGVVHTAGPVEAPLSSSSVEALQTLANEAGNRLGMLRVMAETQLQASTDGLTGLVNRRSFENRERQLRADGRSLAFVMADLDHFKDLNDAYGHETGDRALRIFAETLRRGLRGDDLACRYGGEEFGILLPGADAEEAIEVIERIRATLAHATGRGDAPSFTASFGVASSEEASDYDDLVRRADAALFAAKHAGRDRICVDGRDLPIPPTLAALG